MTAVYVEISGDTGVIQQVDLIWDFANSSLRGLVRLWPTAEKPYVELHRRNWAEQVFVDSTLCTRNLTRLAPTVAELDMAFLRQPYRRVHFFVSLRPTTPRRSEIRPCRRGSTYSPVVCTRGRNLVTIAPEMPEQRRPECDWKRAGDGAFLFAIG